MDRKTRRQYEGVVYTPGRRPAPRKRSKPRTGKHNKSYFPFFYGLTIFTGIVACIVVFTTLFSSFAAGRQTDAPTPARNTPGRPEPTVVAYEQTSDAVGLIKNVGSGTDRILQIYDFNNARMLNLIADGTSDLKDRYGGAIVYAELNIGDIVEVNFEPRGNQLKSLRHSGQAWERRQATRVAVDYAEQTVTLDNDVYAYTDELITRTRGGSSFSIRDVRPIDVLMLKGYQDKLWYAELVRGHGYLEFTDKDLVVDGILEINTDFARDLGEAEYIELLEGMHRIVIRGDNIETFLTEITVERGETYNLDLNDVEFRRGLVTIIANTDDYIIMLDGAEHPPEEPILLTYGNYHFKLTKDGYLPWEETVTINEPIVVIDANLKEEVQLSRFTINSYPAGAEIYVDNSYVGVTPLTISVEYGLRSIVARIPGYKSIDFDRTIEKPTDAIDIYMQEEEPVMPDGVAH